MDDLRVAIFREMASSARDRNQYMRQIKDTYGEEAIPEALRIFDQIRMEHISRITQKLDESELNRPISLNLSWLPPGIAKYQISVGQLILLVAGILIIGSFLFPPFFVTLSNGATTSLGYHIIFDPPVFKHVTINPTSVAMLVGRVDVAVLFAEWACIAVCSFLAWKFLARRLTRG